MKSFIKLFCGLLTTLCLISCNGQKTDVSGNAFKLKQVQLAQIADKINFDFVAVRKQVELFASFTKMIYKNRENLKQGLKNSKYELYQDTVYYKTEDDGGSAVFVSGINPIDDKIKEKVRFTEALDLFMIPVVSMYPEIVQAYMNDYDSYNRIYPWFDVLSQYDPKVDIPAFNFYFLADEKHNPKKKGVWVDEPYVDPAGRGWMISAIAPVYLDGVLECVPGLDITINIITDRYIAKSGKQYMLVTKTGLIVTTTENAARFLSLPPLTDHRYIETVKSDTYKPDEFNLLKSKNKNTRAVAEKLINQNESQCSLFAGEKKYTVLSVPIQELGWRLLEII